MTANVDFLGKGKAFGSLASRLLAVNGNIGALRTNDVLLYDEWKEIDRKVLMAAQQRLLGIADLESRGLVYTIPNGLSKTVLAYQDASDANDAEVSMDGVRRGERDRLEFDINYLPLPIIHKDFSFSLRNILESRNGNMPLDTSMAEMAARKIAEKMEEYLFIGSSSYTFGGGTIHGYISHGSRATYALSAHWNDTAATGETVLADVLGMKQELIDNRHYGPYVLYIPTNFETSIDEDFKAGSDKSIRQRLLEVSGISDIRVADKLTSDNVVLVEMSSEVVRLINGLDIQTIQWDTEGGMQVNFKVMAIKVPQLRVDQDSRAGWCHATL
jgi:uncharacterized linocin/CFP29 family protein